LLSAYGFGAAKGIVGRRGQRPAARAVCGCDVGAGAAAVDPLKLASGKDNMPNAWRAVGPPLAQYPGAAVLVVGGAARRIGLYAVGMAVALGASRVDYADHHAERSSIAERLGARVIESRPGARWFQRRAEFSRFPAAAVH
jgi:hypothetical protein